MGVGMQVIFAVEDVARASRFCEEVGWPLNPLVDSSNYVEFLPPEGGALGVGWFADPDGNVIVVAQRGPTADRTDPAGT